MSKPKLFILLSNGERRALALPEERSASAVSFGAPCPHCGDASCRVSGGDKRIASDDRAYESDAYCVACRKFVGVLRLEVSTLFGLREDEAVLHGRPRVY